MTLTVSRIFNSEKNKDRFDSCVILRLLLFVLIPNLITTPLRIFVEAVIEGKEGAPAFVTVPFIIYGICAELVVGLGYLVIGYKLPIKNTVLRGFAYIMLILISSYIPNILAMLGGDGKIIEESLSMGILVVDVISYSLKGLVLGLLMKNYDVKNPDEIEQITNTRFIICSIIYGVLFAALNYLTDIILYRIYHIHVYGRCSASIMEPLLSPKESLNIRFHNLCTGNITFRLAAKCTHNGILRNTIHADYCVWHSLRIYDHNMCTCLQKDFRCFLHVTS